MMMMINMGESIFSTLYNVLNRDIRASQLRVCMHEGVTCVAYSMNNFL